MREQVQDDLKEDAIPSSCFTALKDVNNHLPMRIGGYTDFYTSLEHCQNVADVRLTIHDKLLSNACSAQLD